jgi:acetylornithine deacetylase
MYEHEEVIATIKENVEVELTPRSTRLRSSCIDVNHPVVKAGIKLGKTTYGSPTASDQALIPLPSLKCGPGFSGQSHSADEFIEVRWIGEAVEFYIALLKKILI